MKKTLCCLLAGLLSFSTSAQFFQQQIQQLNINGAEKGYVVIDTGDTISGTISRVWYQDSLISQVRIKSGEDRLDFPIENIKRLAVIPDDFAPMEEAALGPVLRSIKNKKFIELLPEDGYVIFERIRIPNTGRQEIFRLAQVLNPGWDTKVRVYKHPEGISTGSTSVGLNENFMVTTEGLMENIYYISVDGDPIIEFRDFQYRNKGIERIYNYCAEFKETDAKKIKKAKKKGDGEVWRKLKWKEFPEDLFLHFQKCL